MPENENSFFRNGIKILNVRILKHDLSGQKKHNVLKVQSEKYLGR